MKKKFGRPLVRVPKPIGKGGQQEMLPHRNAVAQLIGGDAFQRSINNYAKLTPSGAGAPATYAALMPEEETAMVEPKIYE